jgi:hypothetical protein
MKARTECTCNKYTDPVWGESVMVDEHCLVHNPKSFRKQLEQLLNKYSKENESNTPDFILAEYMMSCLDAFTDATIERNKWYASSQKPSKA